MQVLVIGCGYLGQRAAGIWQENGCEVFAVTRSAENSQRLQSLGLHPVIADVTKPDSLKNLPATDIVLFAVGFDRTAYIDIRDVYVQGMTNVLVQLKASVKQLIYISSTGVYGDHGGSWIDELTPTSPQRAGGRACLEAEQLIAASRFAELSTVLRLAGIYGPDRIPRLAAIQRGDWASLPSDGHVNLIQVHDAAQIIVEIARQEIRNELFLVSDGNPPSRREFYDYIAQQLNAGPIDWSCQPEPAAATRSGADKKICNQKLRQQVNYSLKFPDYKVGVKAALGN